MDFPLYFCFCLQGREVLTWASFSYEVEGLGPPSLSHSLPLEEGQEMPALSHILLGGGPGDTRHSGASNMGRGAYLLPLSIEYGGNCPAYVLLLPLWADCIHFLQQVWGTW